MQDRTRGTSGTNPIDPEKLASFVQLLTSAIFTGLCHASGTHQAGQQRALPEPTFFCRVPPDASKVYENAKASLSPAVNGITIEAAQLREEAMDFASKCMSYHGQPHGAGAKGAQAVCQNLLEAMTSARCTMARLQIHIAKLLLASETIFACAEIGVDCGLDESTCLGQGWPSLYLGCGVQTGATGSRSALLRDGDAATVWDLRQPGIQPRSQAGASPSPTPQSVLRAMEAGWSQAVPGLRQAVALAAGTSARESVDKKREAVWLDYQRRNQPANPSAKQQRGLDQTAVYAAMDDIAAHVGWMVGEAAGAKVASVYGKAEVYGKDIAEGVEVSAAGTAWGPSQIERQAKQCCEQIIFRHSRTLANEVSDVAANAVRGLSKEFDPVGDHKTNRDTVALICSDETLEGISVDTRAAVKAATFEALSAQAEVLPGMVWSRASVALAANG